MALKSLNRVNEHNNTDAKENEIDDNIRFYVFHTFIIILDFIRNNKKIKEKRYLTVSR